MLNLIPQAEPQVSTVYAEAVSRLASVRHALRLVDGGFSAGPEADRDEEIADRWDEAGPARQHLFDRRSGQLVGTAASGIEALLSQRNAGREPHVHACKTLVDEIRRELREVAHIVLV
jgi:hypothetical protein